MFVFINYKMINDPQDPVPPVAHVCMQALPFRSFFPGVIRAFRSVFLPFASRRKHTTEPFLMGLFHL